MFVTHDSEIGPPERKEACSIPIVYILVSDTGVGSIRWIVTVIVSHTFIIPTPRIVTLLQEVGLTGWPIS